MKLNKIQQRCYDILAPRSDWQAAFLSVCEKNGRYWKCALCAQFLTDANVCHIEKRMLPLIRQIRNESDIFDVL